MGNDNSFFSRLDLNDKAIEVTDFWVHYSATICSGSSVSVFIGEPFVNGPLWLTQAPLEKAAKHLMLYRHPCILKYISSWHKGSKFYLASEDVKPLSIVLATQNTLEICIGLYSVLKAICFLHEKAFMSHNNVCIASIYVTSDGNWKLGGLEYLCRFIDLSEEYLCKTRVHRYDKAIDANENKTDMKDRPDAIDSYAFGVLVNDVLHHANDDIHSLTNFLMLCKNQLQNASVKLRPKLSNLLEHEFFTHDFISVHSFLTELPLKSDEIKAEFFTSITNKLKVFNETMVANHLGGLLLSRIVLLDKNAQQYLLPNIFCPRSGDNEGSNGFFSTDNFKQYIVPRLLQIFCVRDAQIRQLLLEYFNQYMKCFSADELQLQILPELLLGIKDTNDHLVAMTLRALADIVPILGAATVIGGQRGKLFNDGRPIHHSSGTLKLSRSENLSCSTPQLNNQNIFSVTESNSLHLPERPRPDGEEGETSTGDIEQSVEDELEQWDEWNLNDVSINSTRNNSSTITNVSTEYTTPDVTDTLNNSVTPQNSSITNNFDKKKMLGELQQWNVNNTSINAVENNSVTTAINANSKQTINSTLDVTGENLNITVTSPSSDVRNVIHKKPLIDINELDIKNQVTNGFKHDEYNFFEDMEPVIQATPTFLLSHETEKKDKKLNYSESLSVTELEQHIEGWGDSDWE